MEALDLHWIEGDYRAVLADRHRGPAEGVVEIMTLIADLIGLGLDLLLRRDVAPIRIH